MPVLTFPTQPNLFEEAQPEKPKPPKSEPLYVIDSCGGLHSIREINREGIERYARKYGWIE